LNLGLLFFPRLPVIVLAIKLFSHTPRRAGGPALAIALLAALLAPALARAAKPGDLDRSFGDNGRVTTRCPGRCNANAVVIDAQRRIVAAGEGTNARFGLIRYKPSGDLDRSFGGDGRVKTGFPGPLPNALVTSVALDSAGRIVAAGDNCDFFEDSGDPDFRCQFALARYRPNGELDRSFGTNGRVLTSFGTYDWLTSVAIDSEGRIVAGGVHCEGGPCSFVVARYRPNGHLDSSFGGDGGVMTPFGSYSKAESIAIDAQGRIVAAGWGGNGGSSSRFALARYLTNGDLDPSFGASGKVTTKIGREGSGAASAAIDSRGRIVAAGNARRGFALARYWPNGHLDPSFGGDGKVSTKFANARAIASALAIDSRNRLVVTGHAGGDAALARYKPSGDRDRSFGARGKVTTGWGRSRGRAGPYAEAIDARNRIVVAGGHTNFLLMRFRG
jgi:uncharacterized delta-60 repeat protein